MSWAKTEYIDRIELLHTGELFLGIRGPGHAGYQHVYREAAGVYWDADKAGFKSTELKNWTPSEWYAHMVEIVRSGLGVELVIAEKVDWKRLTESDMRAILAESNERR